MTSRPKGKYLRELRSQIVPRGTFNAMPSFVDKAKGATILDLDGRELIDFAGGIGVLNVGHSHPRVVAAIKDQADKFLHTGWSVMMYAPYVQLAEKLCALTPGTFPKMAMFANSGTEAVENAVKIARYYTKRPAIICFETAFHGRSLLTMTLTNKIKPYKFGFGPLAPEVYRMPYAYCYRCPFRLKYPGCDVACADYLKEFFTNQVAPEQTAALIVEPITGEGGGVTPPPEYYPKLIKICHDHGIVFIDDEVQAGMGRTGKMFAMEHWGIEPDIVTAAKSIAAGMPLSAVIGKSEIMNQPDVGALGSTFGGNPLSLRAALAVLEIFEEENILQKAKTLGQKVRDSFEQWRKEYELIGDVRGLGAMLALELVKDRETKEPAADQARKFVDICYEKGLVILACGKYNNAIRTLMPLVITEQELERGLAIMYDGLKEISKS